MSEITYKNIYIYIYILIIIIISLKGKPTGKRPLGRPRRRWEDNIRKDHKGISIDTRKLIDLSQDTYYWKVLVNAALDL